MDGGNIRLDRIKVAVRRCAAVVLYIDSGWSDARLSEGGPWFNDPAHPVRLAIETALRRGIPIVPVLLNGASLPPADRLPESLRPLVLKSDRTVAEQGRPESLGSLVQRTGLAVRPDPDFGPDVERLCAALDTVAGFNAGAIASRRAMWQSAWIAGALLVAHGATLAIVFAALLAQPPQEVSSTSFTAMFETLVVTSVVVSFVMYLLAGLLAGLRTGRWGAGVQAAVLAELIGVVLGGVCLAFAAYAGRGALLMQSTGQGGFVLISLVMIVATIPVALVAAGALGCVGGAVGSVVPALRQARHAANYQRTLAALALPAGNRPAQVSDSPHPQAGRANTGWRKKGAPGNIFISYRRADSLLV